jgi:hypothetical protein
VKTLAMAPPDEDDKRARARRLGKRIVIAVYGGFAAAFVSLAALQITIQCFAVGAGPIDQSTAAGAECANGIDKLRQALNRAAARARTASDADDAQNVFRMVLAPDWLDEPAVRARCAADPRGADAFAALLRLRVAEESHAARDAAEMAALRRELAAYLK